MLASAAMPSEGGWVAAGSCMVPSEGGRMAGSWVPCEGLAAAISEGLAAVISDEANAQQLPAAAVLSAGTPTSGVGNATSGASLSRSYYWPGHLLETCHRPPSRAASSAALQYTNKP